ncbi:MAG: hypothetical protein Q8O40_02620 [Chloroflexota bacterium]|nr:hypothetical protein [Chloroflexota bacterium]
MDYPIVAAVPGQPPRRARLTILPQGRTPMSRHGIPVVVVGEKAYDPDEVRWLDGSPEALEEAAKAGFSTLPTEWSRWPEAYDALEE